MKPFRSIVTNWPIHVLQAFKAYNHTSGLLAHIQNTQYTTMNKDATPSRRLNHPSPVSLCNLVVIKVEGHGVDAVTFVGYIAER